MVKKLFLTINIILFSYYFLVILTIFQIWQ